MSQSIPRDVPTPIGGQTGMLDDRSAAGSVARLRIVLDRVSDDNHARHKALARRMLQENGFALLSLDDAESVVRPWQLDPRPMIMAAPDWAPLEAGLIQRAEVLDRVIADIYGERRLITDGVMPVSLLAGNPSFLAPVVGSRRRGRTWLSMAAVDLARTDDGRWLVLRDHLQQPSGLGYCLENRLIMARTMPLLMDLYRVRRIASFFQQWKVGMVAAAAVDQPLVGVLCPADHGQSSYEARYLASYLGLSLLHGEDMTVRDGRVMLRTIEGLRQLDGLVRFVPDHQTDPLELVAGDVGSGIPGLLQAARGETIRVFNPVGTGVVCGPAFHAWLPAMCRYLTGTALQLDHAPGHWSALGEAPPEMRSSGRRTPPDIGPFAWADGASGFDHAAADAPFQPPLPAWQRGPITLDRTADGFGLDRVPYVLRCFITRTTQGYQVLPGGLVMLDEALALDPLAHSPSALLRDLWIVEPPAPGDGPARQGNPLRRPQPIRRSVARLTSRIAESFYWLGRYMERTEAALRLVRAVATRALDSAEGELRPDFAPRLFGILGSDDDVLGDPISLEIKGAEDLLALIDAVVFSGDLNQGVQRSISGMLFNAERTREHLSRDMGQVLMEMEDLREHADGEDALVATDRLIRTLMAISGAINDNMTHTHEWRFVVMGRRLERAVKTVRLWRHALSVASAPHPALLDILLIQADSHMTYRSRYLARPTLACVLDLLLLDENNPRSLRYQIERLVTLAADLPRPGHIHGLRADEKPMQQLLTQLLVQDAERLVQETGTEGGDPLPGRADPDLAALMDQFAQELPRVHAALHAAFFAHVAQPQRQTQPRTRQ